ncbi:MAG: shikimate kinase [Candidatus Shikimatogenerans bostrichidophilus]|nr:MAG: shikimate kinase [Candidatus Shikimatogenerans bostrichidophilus]
MGSGKTTIGKILSKNIKYKFYDLDILISNFYKLNINDIYFFFGKKYFRIIENKILIFFLKNNIFNSYILSVGGGTPCFLNNMYLMNKFANTIYLKTNKKILFKRLLNNKNNRPIIKNLNKKKLFLFIKNHLNKRYNIYMKSKYILNTNVTNFENLANYIIKFFKKKNYIF